MLSLVLSYPHHGYNRFRHVHIKCIDEVIILVNLTVMHMAYCYKM